MKILITGGAGFIGSNFLYYYVKKYPKDRIVVVDNLTYAGNLSRIVRIIDGIKVKFVKRDICDKAAMKVLFKKNKFDVVVNFAAETHVDRSIIDPSLFFRTNIIGTSVLLECSKKFSVRYHQVSTDEVYGDLGFGSKNYFTEQTSINPNCPYAASKASADLLVMSYYRTYGLKTTISRCSNNYGPRQYPEKLIPYFFKLALEDRPLPIYGTGLNVRDWLYVDDHCEAIDLIIKNGKIGEVYNIGGHNEFTNLEIAQKVLGFLGKDKSNIKFVEDRKAHDERYAMDASKIERELGWQPKITFEEGIKKTFEWYSKRIET